MAAARHRHQQHQLLRTDRRGAGHRPARRGVHFLSRHDLDQLRAAGVSPAAALTRICRATVARSRLALIQLRHFSSEPLLWVFAAIVGLAVMLLLVTSLMLRQEA